MLPRVKPIEERVKRRAVSALMVALGTGLLAVSAPTPAQAAPAHCNPSWTKVNGEGYVVAWQDYNNDGVLHLEGCGPKVVWP